MLQKTEINNIDVSSKIINWELEKTFGDAISQIEIKLVKTVSTLLTIETGQTVEVWRGWSVSTEEKIFDGYIESYEPEGGIIKVIAKDKLWDLIRKEVTHVYDKTIDASAGVISEIFSDLVITYGLLTADATSIQDSGTTILLDKFVCNHTDIFERCKELAKLLDWQFYYNSNTDKVYFEPRGFVNNSTILTIGDNIINVPKWTYDNTEMVNDLTVVGAFQEIETTESGQIDVTANYTTSSILLSFEPISVKLYMDAANPPTTLKVGGLPDSTGTYFYYVDKPNKKIIPATGTSFTTNHFAEIRYSHAVPIPVHMYNQISIDDYGQFKKTLTYNDIRSVSDAEQRATNYLIKYSTPFIYATLKVKNVSTYNLREGNIIRVVDSVSTPNVDKNLVITRLRIRYPSDYDEIVVGDKAFRLAEWQSSVEERLKRLNENELANQDLINEILTFDNTVSNQIQPVPRYYKIIKQDFTGTDELIWNNADYGTWGSFKWSSGAGPAEVNHFIQQYNNSYTETFFDDDFKSGSSTATWSNADKWLSFTSGQIGQSLSIDFNNSTITTATLTATVSSGSFTYQMTANGGTNWENVTNGVAHTFSNTGTDLRWKITENAASTGKITQIVINSYH